MEDSASRAARWYQELRGGKDYSGLCRPYDQTRVLHSQVTFLVLVVRELRKDGYEGRYICLA